MFWDVFFSLLFLIVGIYALLGIFIDMSEFEWKIIRWFRRTFKLCDHPYGREYKVREYVFGDEDESLLVVYDTRCGSCHRDMGSYVIDVEDIIDIDNLRTVVDNKWHCMSLDEADIITKRGTKIK